MRRTSATLIAVSLLLAACSGDEDAAADATPTVEASADAADGDGGTGQPTPEPTSDGTDGRAGQDDGPQNGPEDGPDDEATPEPEPTPAGPSFADAPRRVVPLGEFEFLVALTPDGEHLVVDAPSDEGSRCEESQAYALQTRPVSDDTAPFASLFDPPRSGAFIAMADGRRLVFDGCEGIYDDVAVARFTGDGTARVTTPVTLPYGQGGIEITGIAPLPGTDQFEAVRFTEFGPDLVRFTADGTIVSGPTPVDRDYYNIAATASGTYAVRFRQDVFVPEVVELRTDRRLPSYGTFVSSADGSDLLVAGDGGLGVVRADGSLERWIDDPLDDGVDHLAPVWVAEDRALVIRAPFEEGALLLVGPEGIVEVVDTGVSDFPTPSVSADATRLVYSVYDPDTNASTAVLRDLR